MGSYKRKNEAILILTEQKTHKKRNPSEAMTKSSIYTHRKGHLF